MSDIFLSYAAEDRDAAGRLATALAARGWSVWWDRTIPAGTRFDHAIAAEIAAARAVVVLWSEASVKSRWVLEEAEDALEREILIPAMLGEVRLPLGFRRVQCVPLDQSAQSLEALAAAIARVAAPATADGPVHVYPKVMHWKDIIGWIQDVGEFRVFGDRFEFVSEKQRIVMPFRQLKDFEVTGVGVYITTDVKHRFNLATFGAEREVVSAQLLGYFRGR